MQRQKRNTGIGMVLGIAGIVILTTGCLLRLYIGAEYYANDLGAFIGNIFMDVSTAYCQPDPMTGAVDCLYSIEDAGGGRTTTSTARLISELGLVGIIIDPLILELPASTRNIRGTYSDGSGNSGDLSVYANLQTVPADDDRNFVASPGKQLVIVDLPRGVPIDGVDYSFSLQYERPAQPGAPPTDIKAILTGRIDIGGKTYYPPFLPCTTDFSAVPSFNLPQAASAADALQPIALPSNPQACANEPYFYFSAESSNVPCDLDNDTDVDYHDLTEILRTRNVHTSVGDPRDVNDDGLIDLNDARVCVPTCTRALCAG